MSYRVHYKGYVIEAETDKELKPLLAMLQVLPATASESLFRAEPEHESQESKHYANDDAKMDNEPDQKLDEAGIVRDSQGRHGDSTDGHELIGDRDDDQDQNQDVGGQPQEKAEDSEDLGAQMRRLMAIIPSRQQRLIDLLLGIHPKGFHDTYLRSKLDLKDNHDLGGILTGLTKNATKCGLASIIRRQKSSNPGSKYAYFLNGKLAAFLKDRKGDE